MKRRKLLQNTLAVAPFLIAGHGANANAETAAKRKFTIDLSPGAIGVGAKAGELIELAAAHGFESIQPDAKFLASLDKTQRKEFVERLHGKGLTWGAAGLPVDFRKDEDTFKEGIEGLPELAAALEDAGVTRVGTWLMPRHDSLTYVANFRQHASRLGEVTKILADHGLRFGLEYVGTYSLWTGGRNPFIHSMAETKDLIAEIDQPTIGFVLDSWHWYTAGETADDILTLKNEDIVACDLNDAPTGIAKEELNDTSRELPAATGIIDTAPFLRALAKLGYDGPVRAEPFNKPLRELEDGPAAEATAKALREAVSRAGL